MANVEINLPLPVLPEGWAGEKDFKPVGSLSKTNDRKIEPVGPHFLAYARRVRYLQTISHIHVLTHCPGPSQAHFLRG